MRHSRLRRTIGLPRRAGATTCLPTFYYLSRPTKAPLFRSILLRSRLLSFALGFIRSTSILRRVAHTNVSLILLHSILYSFYPSAYSLLSALLFFAFPRPLQFYRVPYLPRFVSDRELGVFILSCWSLLIPSSWLPFSDIWPLTWLVWNGVDARWHKDTCLEWSTDASRYLRVMGLSQWSGETLSIKFRYCVSHRFYLNNTFLIIPQFYRACRFWNKLGVCSYCIAGFFSIFSNI